MHRQVIQLVVFLGLSAVSLAHSGLILQRHHRHLPWFTLNARTKGRHGLSSLLKQRGGESTIESNQGKDPPIRTAAEAITRAILVISSSSRGTAQNDPIEIVPTRTADAHLSPIDSIFLRFINTKTENTKFIVSVILLNGDEPIGIIDNVLSKDIDDQAMLETLAVLCSSTVIVPSEATDPMNMDESEDWIDGTLKAIIDGARRRKGASMEAGMLIAIVNSPPLHPAPSQPTPEQPPSDEAEWWRTCWALSHTMSGIQPKDWVDFQMLVPSEMHPLDKHLARTSGNELYSDVATFTRLVQRVYHNLADREASSLIDVQVIPCPPVASEPADHSQPQEEEGVQGIDSFVDDKKTDATRHGKQASPTTARESSAPQVPQILATARSQLAALESKLEDFWLQQAEEEEDSEKPGSDDNAGQQLPLLEFGETSNQILVTAQRQLSTASLETSTPILMQIAAQLQRLYLQQLNSLRDYYGRRYERILEQERGNEKVWADAAAHMTEGFRAAAQHAIPSLCQRNGLLRDADFEYVQSLQGLIQDMMTATELRQDGQSAALATDEAAHGNDGNGRLKWCKKIAARALMLGVNYAQGWLAWQGVKRAAAERDRTMPKFPLF